MNTLITVEILYPEIANLFGDSLNMKYLQQCIPDAKFVETSLTDTPLFVNSEPTLIYMGSMTEHQQEIAIRSLRPHKESIIQHIGKGTIFLITGNALELFGSYIENEDGTKIEALGIFSTYAKRQMMKRYNSLILGEFEDMKIIGYKNQFSHSYGDNSRQYFYKVMRGAGINPSVLLEGLRENHFFATYTLGPLLVQNPPFTKYLLSLMGVEPLTLAHEQAAMEAYKKRLSEYENEKLQY